MVKQSQMYVMLDALNVIDGNAQHTSIFNTAAAAAEKPVHNVTGHWTKCVTLTS